MEKLQAALTKAREKRAAEAGHSVTEKPNASQTQRRPGNSADAAWQRLRTHSLPNDHLELNRIVSGQASASAAPFDILRTKILVQMRKNGWRRLAITSPTPNSGKTTIACNLALGLGRQEELRTMLLDLDLRSPSMSEYLGCQPERGLGSVLMGEIPFEEQAFCINENVAISGSPTPETDPSRLLLSEETFEVLNSIEKLYEPDIMIFDLPSLLVNDDTRAFLKNVDCALIVVRSNDTRFAQFDKCERELAEQTNVLGAVLNAYSYGKET